MVLPFEKEYKERFYQLMDEVFESNFWSDGKMTRTFEEKFGEFTGLYACAVTSGGAGLLSILEYVDVRAPAPMPATALKFCVPRLPVNGQLQRKTLTGAILRPSPPTAPSA